VDQQGERRSLCGVYQLARADEEELLSIVDTSVATWQERPCIDPIFGPTQASKCWSSTGVSRTSRGS
jgi:hypothetical protein